MLKVVVEGLLVVIVELIGTGNSVTLEVVGVEVVKLSVIVVIVVVVVVVVVAVVAIIVIVDFV